MTEKRAMELKKAIINWLFDNKSTWQRTSVCREYCRPYIYNADGNYLIGGEEISDFIIKADKLIYGGEINNTNKIQEQKNEEWIRKAQEQLTPKRIDRWRTGHPCCPKCKRGVVKDDKFCVICGQALDWSFEKR